MGRLDVPQILTIDMGSQYTWLFSKQLQKLGFRTAILNPDKSGKWLKQHRPKGIILSGGDRSVYDPKAPQPPEGILGLGIPILGICYGMQWLAHVLGGRVRPEREKREYGKATACFNYGFRLLDGFDGKAYEESTVWSSHGDSVTDFPEGFKVLATTRLHNEFRTKRVLVGMCDTKRDLYGLQFHPEVTQTEYGLGILKNFVANIADCKPDWSPRDIISDMRDEIARIVGNRRALFAFSGGVDSSALATIAAPALGPNVLATTIDHGGLRQDELREIRAHARAAGMRLEVLRRAFAYHRAIGKATHGEVIRHRFGGQYHRDLENRIRAWLAHYFFQGTLAPDKIESGHKGKSALIKSHHNVGHDWSVPVIEPFENFFKYEIREFARLLGLPDSVVNRMPFPGPGLWLRVNGAPITFHKLKIVRWAEAEVTRILKEAEFDETQTEWERISQLVVSLNCVKYVGVKGDSRAYCYPAVVRAVKTIDYMTAEGLRLRDATKEMIERVLTAHPEIVRVFYDETDKPPGTIEPV